MRSEPLLEEALRFARSQDLLPRPGEAVLCAVSGGADSMCLLHWLWILGRREGFSVSAAHYNHHIRGSFSDRDEAFVHDWCAQRAIPFVSGGEDVPAQAARTGLGLEETARQMRYAFLTRQAREMGCALLATAHQADDNIETLLLHLLRGAGLRGLTGIPPRRGNIVRPLLTTPRAEIEAYLAAFSIPHVEDETNQDGAYTRNRVRGELIPLLRTLQPNLTPRLTQTIFALRADEALLSGMAECGLEREGDTAWADADALAALPEPLALRAAKALLETPGGEDVGYTAAHLRSILALCRSQSPSARIDLPRGRQARREYGRIVVGPAPAQALFSPVPLVPDGVTPLPGWQAVCRRGTRPPGQRPTPEHFYLKASALAQGAFFRPRQEGDRIALPGRPAKSVKKLFIDEKLPRQRREQIPLLCCGETVLAVGGFGCDTAWLAEEGEPGWEIFLTGALF